MIKLERYKGNPIIVPNPNNPWEAFATFNPGVVQIKGKIYIIYRAQSHDYTSVLGLAITEDGFNIEERLDEPIYVPRMGFEMKTKGKITSGCEDPRLTIIDDRIYMLYTAVGESGPFIKPKDVIVTKEEFVKEWRVSVRVGFTSIKVKDFLKRRWDRWEIPKLISPPGTWDKDACIFERKIKGKYVFIHRLFPDIWIDFVEDLSFKKKGWLHGWDFIHPRPGKWDSCWIGIAGPPIYTKEGWILLYHGRGDDGAYRVGALLLDRENPTYVVSRLDYPILEPEKWYETETCRVVFPCGHAILDDKLLVYYGASDKYVCVAYCNFNDLLSELLKNAEW